MPRTLISTLLAFMACAWLAAPALADLPAGSWVFDDQATGVVASPGGSGAFVRGPFAGAQAPTGGTLTVPVASGTVDPSAFPHVAGRVYAVATDGSGGWYVGGLFERVGGTARRNLAHIGADGLLDATFSPNPDGPVYAIALSGSTLYAGGAFTAIGGQARNRLAAVDSTTGNATSFNASLSGPSTSVSALVLSGSTLYVGGFFTSIGGQTRHYLAALDTATATATSFDPAPDQDVRRLLLSGSTLYVTGNFSTIGGQARYRIAALDTTTGGATAFDPNPSALSGVTGVALSGAVLYVGGTFTSIGGQPRHNLAAVDASTGIATAFDPNPIGRDVRALAVSGTTLYVGGAFTSIAGQARNRLAALDTTTGNATAFNPRLNNAVDSLALAGGTLYVGGSFSGAGPLLATVPWLAHVKVDGSLDTAFVPSPNGQVDALAPSGNTLFVGGSFTAIGGQNRNYLAAVDAVTGAATSFDPSPNSSVADLAISGGPLYVGGLFSTIGGQARQALAAIDTATANATAFNPDPQYMFAPTVRRLVLAGSTLYVNGVFTSIGGQARNYLAAVDTTTGSATPFNPNPNTLSFYSLAFSENSLFVAGGFSSIGGQSRSGLAALDATTGNATSLNPTKGGSVLALAVSGNTLYLGGIFASMGGQPRNNLAAVDATTGTTTSFNPNTVSDPVGFSAFDTSLAASGSTLYVAGTFSSIGDQVTGPFAIVPIEPPLDTTPPTITVTTPAEGQHFTEGDTVTSAFSCDDGSGSGVASCVGPATVDTSTVGNQTFTVTATDAAGNPATKTVNYVVDAAAPSVIIPPTGRPTHGDPFGPLGAAAVAASLFGVRATVELLGGVVLVKRPGDPKPVRLQDVESVPIGTIVDTSMGRARITVGRPGGRTESLVAYGGIFQIRESRQRGILTELLLVGGDFAGCPSVRVDAASAVKRRGKHDSVRQLWSRGKGRFRTRGRYGSATVRGTWWLTQDRCDGTFVRVRSGVVAVRDFPKKQTVLVRKGRTYLARAPRHR